MKAHVHAEVIKAWADGAIVEVKTSSGWQPIGKSPSWSECNEYRIRPAEPERVYPVTGMTGGELDKIYFNCRRGNTPRDSVQESMLDVANTALRHAIDAGQVVIREEFDRAVGDRKARDMAVAEAVHNAARSKFTLSATVHPTQAYAWIPCLDLAAIIAEVKP